jgi:hypothetical protein
MQRASIFIYIRFTLGPFCGACGGRDDDGTCRTGHIQQDGHLRGEEGETRERSMADMTNEEIDAAGPRFGLLHKSCH